MIHAAWARLADIPEALPADWLRGLSVAESERAERFHRPLRKRQYVIGHRLLRLTAGSLSGIDPDQVGLPAEGRPQSIGPEKPSWLSVSHSGGFAVAVASDEGPVGVDIETADQIRDWEKLAESLGWIGGEEGTKEGFLRAWTLREAEFKADVRNGIVWRSETPEFQLTLVALTASPIKWLTPDAPSLRRAR